MNSRPARVLPSGERRGQCDRDELGAERRPPFRSSRNAMFDALDERRRNARARRRRGRRGRVFELEAGRRLARLRPARRSGTRSSRRTAIRHHRRRHGDRLRWDARSGTPCSGEPFTARPSASSRSHPTAASSPRRRGRRPAFGAPRRLHVNPLPHPSRSRASPSAPPGAAPDARGDARIYRHGDWGRRPARPRPAGADRHRGFSPAGHSSPPAAATTWP